MNAPRTRLHFKQITYICNINLNVTDCKSTKCLENGYFRATRPFYRKQRFVSDIVGCGGGSMSSLSLPFLY
jgi:hypothetical protein